MFDKLKAKVSELTTKAGAKIVKHSPEILFGIGCVGFIGTVVLAVKKAPEIKETLEDHNARNNLYKTKYATDENYTKDMMDHDIRDLYKNTFFRVVRLSAPVAAAGAFSLGCFGSAQYIVCRRLSALATEYVMLDKTYKTYRSNVRAEEGAERDLHYLYSTERRTDKVPVLDEDGNITEKESKPYDVVNTSGNSILLCKETVKTGWFSGIDIYDEATINAKIKNLKWEYKQKKVLTRVDVLRAFGLQDELDRTKDTAWMFGKFYSGDPDDLNITVKRSYIPDYSLPVGDRTLYHLTWDEGNLYNKL